jgi:DNA-binding response OmpR family regulator
VVTTPKRVIVYVEDNSGDALLLREALVDSGHDVELLVIEHGEKALHYFEVKARARDLPPPHCILLDDHLPIVTGIQLITFLRRHDAYDKTPVFIFASPKEYATERDSVDISADSFLRKPSEWGQFCELADMLARGAWLSEQLSDPTTSDKPSARPEELVAPPSQLRQQ